MSDIFEYDVFLSFASSDEPIVKPVWQELCLSGLRVFWSDASLKQEVGNSWFQVIQSSLEKSRHLLLICSPASMASKWVQREYSAFFNHCYNPGVRRLIPILAQGYKISDLPLFFKDIEARQLEAPHSIKEIISILGGVNIEELKTENQFLKQNLESLSQENSSLKVEIRNLIEKLQKQEERHEVGIRTEAKNTLERKPALNLNKGSQAVDQEASRSEKQEAFKFLGLSLTSNSKEIIQRYKVLKTEYETLISDCPTGLRDICELRLRQLENAFDLIFYERKEEEDQRIDRAFELLQLSRGVNKTMVVERFNELRAVCLKAMKSSDTFIKEAAAKELEKLEEAISALLPEDSRVEVVMPLMGENIAEATITNWLKREGEIIEKDEPLFEISTDKVDAEIPSPAEGVLEKILFAEGDTVDVNTVVAHIKLPKSRLTIH